RFATGAPGPTPRRSRSATCRLARAAGAFPFPLTLVPFKGHPPLLPLPQLLRSVRRRQRRGRNQHRSVSRDLPLQAADMSLLDARLDPATPARTTSHRVDDDSRDVDAETIERSQQIERLLAWKRGAACNNDERCVDGIREQAS